MPKQRLTAAEKVARDEELIKDRARGMTWAKIAKKHDIAERNARVVWADYRDTKMPVLQGKDAIDVVFEILSRYEAWQGDLAEIAEGAKGTNKVGAIKAQMDCENRRTELMQATGLLPKHLGKIKVDFDVRYVVTRVVALFDKYGVPPDAQRELLDVLQASASDN